MWSLSLVALFSVGVANGQGVTELKAHIQSLRNQIIEQRELIKVQEDRLVEAETAEARRLQLNSYVTVADANVEFGKLDTASLGGALDSFWLCLCGSLVMFMHAGFAMLETGSCRAKNASNVLMKNLVNVCVGTIGWWLLGWGIAYGSKNGTDFFGTDGFVGQHFYTRDASGNIQPLASCDDSGCQSTMLSWFFQWAFCTAGATIVSGAVAERIKGPTYAAFAFVMTSFIYPVVVSATWGGGWLASEGGPGAGYMDFAGSGVVHLTGGIAGLAGTIVLGPRKGRFEYPEDFEAHNLPLVVFGTFALWFGWYGFNPGSTLTMKSGTDGALAAQVAMNTTLAAAAGGLTVFILPYILTKKYDVGGLCNGILAGLVSITAGCGNMECGCAMFTGLMGGIIYTLASKLLVVMKIDDPVDASPVHGFCGFWGCLAAAFFDWGLGFTHFNGWNGFGCTPNDANNGCKGGHLNGTVLWVNFAMCLCIILWSGLISGLTFAWLKWWGGLRIDEATEDMGMDAKSHSPPKAYALA